MKTRILAALLLVPALSAQSATVTFVDATFNNSDWSASELRDTTPANTFVFTGTQLLTGGNPGSYRQVTQASVSGIGENVSIVAGHVYLPGSFDPATDGAIASISYAMDGISINATAGAVGYSPLLIQNDTAYVAFGFSPLNAAGWQSMSFNDLSSADFFGIINNGFDFSAHPDFTASGAPLVFGFASSNGTFGDSFNEGGMDNWRVDINSVPAPASLPLLLTAFAGLASRTRRVRRSRG